MDFRLFSAIVLILLVPLAMAEDRRPSSAVESLRKAQVGTFSPRLAPPLRVETTKRAVEDSQRKTSKVWPERIECQRDPSRHSNRLWFARLYPAQLIDSQ